MVVRALLDAGQRPGEQRREPGTDRADHHDPALGPAQQRQEHLVVGKLPGDVGLEQRAEIAGAGQLERAEAADAGVVQPPGQASRAGVLGDGPRGGGDLGLVGGVGGSGVTSYPGHGLLQRGAVGGPADPGVDVQAAGGQARDGGPADARRGAGDSGRGVGRNCS